MSRFTDLVHEIHRRSLWQVLAVYIVASWVTYEAVVTLYEGIGLPDWVPGTALVLLLLGLPLVLATAFVQEGAPGLGGDGADPGPTADRVPGLETTAETTASQSTPDPAATDQPEHRADPGVHPEPRTWTSSPTPTPRATPSSLFTWGRAFRVGVLAFAVLGLAATGFMGMRALGIGPAATLVTSGALDERDPLVLADFANATSDSTLGVTVTEALRTDLEQSDVLRLVGTAKVQDALDRMQRPDTIPITPGVAREIAIRDGYKAYIEGEIREVGGQYLLTARVVTAAEGEVLASFDERAEDAAGIIEAIDRLGGEIRGKVGESLAAIRGEPPLPTTASASLEAVGHFTQGWRVFDRKGDQLAALRHFERAVEEDSAFASAWVMIATMLSNLGIEQERRLRALEQAYRYRDRLTEAERHVVAAYYHDDITGDQDRAMDEYEAALAVDSASGLAAGVANNLALLYRDQRNHDRAVELLRLSIAIMDSVDAGGGSLVHSNLIIELMYASRYDEAREAMAEMAERFPDHRRTHARRIAFAGMAADYAAVDSLAEAYLRRFGDGIEGRNGGRANLAYSAAVQGRLEDATQYLRATERDAAGRDWNGEALQWATIRIRTRALMDQEFGRAVADLDGARERYGYDTLPPPNIPYTTLAGAYARLGAADRAREVLVDYRREIPEARREASGAGASVAEALIALQEDRLDDAEAALDAAARRSYCDFCRLPFRGMLAERRGETEEAIRLYTRYLEQPWLRRLDDDAQHRVFVILRLADLHEQEGNRTEAARYHSEFLDLWSDADPALQPRVDAARRTLARLTGEDG